MMPIMTSCGLYYKPITIINDDSRVVNKLETSLTDDARVFFYDLQMFIVQATENVDFLGFTMKLSLHPITSTNKHIHTYTHTHLNTKTPTHTYIF